MHISMLILRLDTVKCQWQLRHLSTPSPHPSPCPPPPPTPPTRPAPLQSSKLEALLAASEEASRVLVESKEAVEGGMLEALRSQLLAVEQRLEVERREHHARQAAASQRQQVGAEGCQHDGLHSGALVLQPAGADFCD